MRCTAEESTFYFGERLGLMLKSLAALLRSLRLHQWVKNVLIFLPILMGHDLSLEKWRDTILGFLAFGFCASAVYLLNDLVDFESDRNHPVKRHRPIASGALSRTWVPAVSMVLIFTAAILAWQVNIAFGAVLVVYLIATSLYTLWLKRVVIVDVLVLAGLYVLRVIAGGVASEIVISKWLMTFCFFFFLSLAFAKRYAELARHADEESPANPSRAYWVSDLDLIQTLGPNSGYLAVLVLTLYINSDEMSKVYHYDWPLWLICPLILYWLSRVWLFAKRRQLNEDPILFAFRDSASILVGCLAVALWCMASWLPK